MVSIDQNYLKMTSLSYFNKFSSIKCLSTTKNLVNAKLLVVGKLLVVSKHLVDTNLFSVGKHLVDEVYEEPLWRKRTVLTEKMNSRPVRRTDLNAKISFSEY